MQEISSQVFLVDWNCLAFSFCHLSVSCHSIVSSGFNLKGYWLFFCLIMPVPGSMRWRARNLMMGSLLGAAFGFPLGKAYVLSYYWHSNVLRGWKHLWAYILQLSRSSYLGLYMFDFCILILNDWSANYLVAAVLSCSSTIYEYWNWCDLTTWKEDTAMSLTLSYTGWLHLKLVEMAQEGKETVENEGGKSGVGAAIERLEANLRKWDRPTFESD